MAESTIIERLAQVQSNLHAPKNQENRFGGYRYRSCEDILEAVKPLLHQNGLSLILSDEIVAVGDRVYVRAKASIIDTLTAVEYSTTAYAREELTKKGMDASQITGSASSYARKYALNGLFLIDDTKDADTNEQRSQSDNSPEPAPARTRAPRGSTKKPASAADAVAEEMAKIGTPLISDEDFSAISKVLETTGVSPTAALAAISTIVGHPVKHPKDLTSDEGAKVADSFIEAMAQGVNPFTGEMMPR